MLTFRTISISDREWIQKALQQSQYQGCEYSFANNLAWYREVIRELLRSGLLYHCGI